MILSFAAANFRSIKTRQELSLEADAGKSKPDNLAELETASGPLRVLTSAVIYGPNASGKSNLIRALHVFRTLVTGSAQYRLGEPLEAYEPFRLDPDMEQAPVHLDLEFLLGQVKYRYTLAFTRYEVVQEKLTFYPEGTRALLYERVQEPGDSHRIDPGKKLKRTRFSRQVFRHQLFLSRFGTTEPHPQLTEVFKFIQQIEIWNASDAIRMGQLRKQIVQDLALPEQDPEYRIKLSKLIASADTGIREILVKEIPEEEFRFPEDFPAQERRRILEENAVRVYARHPGFRSGEPAGSVDFELHEESAGTQVLFGLGGMALKKLESGGILVFDELDNSLHPRLARFLVRLFMSPVSNPHHAQLIFATHEVSLIGKEMFRKDQIWFTQKDRTGASELYGAADFPGVRDDAPFDRLYMTGKFQAQPRIKESAFLHEAPGI